MMNADDIERQLIHDCSKDDAAFRRLIALFNRYHAEKTHHERILRNLLDVVFETDGNGLWQFLSPAWETMTGFSVDESVGKPFIDYIYAEDQPENWREFMPLFENRLKDCHYDTRYRRKSGGYCYVEVHARLALDQEAQVTGVVGILRDITERKRLQHDLDTSEARYRLLADHIHDLVVIHNLDGTVRYASPSSEYVLGYTPEELIAMPPNQLVHPDDRHILKEELGKLVDERPLSARNTYRMIHKSGEIIWIESEVGRIYDDAGNLDSIVVSSRNITERKQIEERLRRSEELYRLLAENITDEITLHTPEGRVIYANRAVLAASGRTLDEILAMTAEQLAAIVHPDDIDRTREEAHQQVLQGKTVTRLRYRLRRKDGIYRWVETYSLPIFDDQGEVVQILASSRDITAYKQLEDSLRESERLFNYIANNIPGIIYQFEIDADGVWHFPFISQGAMTHYGFAEDELREDELLLVKAVHPDDYDAMFEHVNRSQQDLSLYEFTHRLINPDGEIVWLHASATPERTPDGGTLWTGIAMDITARKHAQQRELELTLEHERRRLLTTFIQHAAHEFRTPLATINTSTYLITRTDDPERVHLKAEEIERQVNRITRLIDMLLSIVRLESTPARINTTVNMGAVIRSASLKLRTQYGEQPVLRMVGLNALPPVHANADDLMNAFTQVLDNAYRFTPETGNIIVQGSVEAEWVRLEIRDTGMGINANDMPHVFETFWRADHSHTTPGFGLGLPIAQKIITQYGGDIHMESDPGQGTTVTITLPRIAV